MNLELTDEQVFLRDAARQALSRTNTVEAAREALDGGARPDLWPAAVEAGWPGLLVSEERGGAGLGAFDAMLVLQEAGRRLAGVELLGHLPASALLDAAGYEATEAVAAGDARAVFVAAQPPGDLDDGLDGRGARLAWRRAAAPTVADDGTVERRGAVGRRRAGRRRCSWSSRRATARRVAVAVEAGDGRRGRGGRALRPDAAPRPRDVRRRGGHGARRRRRRRARAARGTSRRRCSPPSRSARSRRAWRWRCRTRRSASRSGGRSAPTRRSSTALVEVLRRQENARSLLYYAGWAHESGPRRVPARGVRGALGGRRGARLRGAREHRRARRHRRDVGARRAAVLPPRAADRGGCSAGRRARPTAWPASC